MEVLKAYLSRRIRHAQERVDQFKVKHGDSPTKDFNYYGGHSLGYWEGLLTAYQNTLDEINALEEYRHESTI